jgi:hypothetical protein
VFCRPATTITDAVKTVERYEDLAFEERSFKDSFWGRGLVTTWYLSIEEDIMSSHNVDLSRLSEIKIAMRYRCFSSSGFSGEVQINDIPHKAA